MNNDHSPVCPVCFIKGHSAEACPVYLSAMHHISGPVHDFKGNWMDLGRNGPLLGGALFLASKVIDMAPHAFWPRQQLVGTINMRMYRRDWRDGKLLAELGVIGDASEEPELATWKIDRHTSSLLENHAGIHWEGHITETAYWARVEFRDILPEFEAIDAKHPTGHFVEISHTIFSIIDHSTVWVPRAPDVQLRTFADNQICFPWPTPIRWAPLMSVLPDETPMLSTITRSQSAPDLAPARSKWPCTPPSPVLRKSGLETSREPSLMGSADVDNASSSSSSSDHSFIVVN